MKWRRQLIISTAAALGLSGVAWATTLGDPASTSASYRLNESMIGGTGDYESGSTSFRFEPGTDDGGATLGDIAVGNSASTNFQSNSGFNTTNSPGLSMVVNTSSVNLGTLSTSAATTDIATFYVKNYTSHGYVVQVVGSTPSYGANSLDALTTASCGDAWGCASSAGTEQFGINLVANTSPGTVGANPLQDVELPAYSFGVAGDGITGTYGTSRPYTVNGRYRYVSGETVASAPKSSGKTTYTVAFLANIANTTAAGSYQGNLSIVATGMY